MEEKKSKIYTTVAIVALLGLLFGCILGALAGGAAGFVVGKRQARIGAESLLRQRLEQGLGSQPGFQAPGPSQGDQACPRCGPEENGPVPTPGMMPQMRQGALIQEVILGSPAEDAGLKPGDVIVAVDRTPIDRSHPLVDVIGQYKPGDPVTIRFWRGGQEDSVQVRLGENPDAPGQAYLGVRYGMMGPQGPGD